MGIVDAHLHLWDPRRLPMGWLEGIEDLDRLCSGPTYLGELGDQAARLEGAVLVEAAVDPGALEPELEWMLEQREAAGPVRAVVAGWAPRGEEQATDAWLRLLESSEGVVGVREVLHGAGETAASLRDPRLLRSVRMAGERGLVVDLCVRPDQLAAAGRLMREASGTRFMLDHLGRPRVGWPTETSWKDCLASVADLENVDVKLSGLLECAEGRAVTFDALGPLFDHALARFGPERMAWGSNWPVCRLGGTIGEWVALTDRLLQGCSEPDRACIRRTTALRVYGLLDQDD